jgi:type I restriction enzyme, S subunit
MGFEFHETPIEELCIKVTSGLTPLRSRSDFYENGSIDWYKTGELSDWYLDPAQERISEKALLQTSIKLFPADTVLMAMYGDGKTITNMGMLRSAAATNQACAAMIVNPDICHTRYFFYALKSRRDLLLKVASGGAQRNLSGKLMKEFRLPVPPLHVQQRIASILSAYDELIENSQRRIKILEAMARGLYREWFVHFRFPGHENHPRVASAMGEIPQGWEVMRLGDIVDISWGDTSTTKASYVPDGYPAFSASGMDGKLDHYDYDRVGIVLSAIGAQCGKTWLARGKWSCIKNTIRFWANSSKASTEFLFIATFGQDFWPRRGAAQPFISQGDGQRIELLIPDARTMNFFTEFVSKIFVQITILEEQTNNLRNTRDLLLPRLLSGQINVEAAEHV